MAKRARNSRSQDSAASKAKKPRNKSSTAVRAATSMQHDEGTRRVQARLTPACIHTIGDADILATVQNSATTTSPIPILVHDGVVKPAASEPLSLELQTSSCQSSKYRLEEFPHCVSCIRRKGNDSCRFKGIRFLLRDAGKVVVGTRFKEGQGVDSTPMEFPKDWNVPLTMSHVSETKVVVARALLPVLKEDLQHLELHAIIHRPRETTVRATCDTCKTSIFSSTFMCRICGREACLDCFNQIKILSVSLIESKLPSWRPALHVHPFLTCAKDAVHSATDFVPMSRFCKTELQNVISDMQDLLDTVEAEALLVPELNSSMSLTPGIDSDTLTGVLPCLSKSDEAPTWSTSQAAPDETPSHTTLHFSNDELTDDKFKQVWQKGEAIVVTGLLPRFRLQWTPQYFQEKHGSDRCSVIECQTDQEKLVTVDTFFALFGNYKPKRGYWKLKDWPPSEDFREKFPELYDDFSQATPVPNYVRRDGVLNIASHFPSNIVVPDIGPKMYNALASSDSASSNGSTRLHLDIADALNIMLYSSQTPDGRPGCAAWDIFNAEDSALLRKFLQKKFAGEIEEGLDPIHAQQFFLNETSRQELYEEFGVCSHRIYQVPGEAVFIPAGCAHQVCNVTDCIKVACDFVSPENVARCEVLTREFREQNQIMRWKEDVLQLKTMLWFAWLSCVHQEKEGLVV